MARESTAKEIAGRIDPTYYRRRHPLRRLRFWLGAGCVLVAAGWVGLVVVFGQERVFANGPVAPSHALIEERCDTCHTEGFGPVYDPACLACHDAGPHLSPGSGTVEPACAACHAEHRGRAGLAQVADARCNKCHEKHAGIESFDAHPPFRPAQRVRGLRFDHGTHLAADLVGGPLECGSCHRPEAQGRNFEPLSFSASCERCHRERIDETAKSAVPHGIPPARLRAWIASALLERGGPELRPQSAVPGRGAASSKEWREALRDHVDRAFAALFPSGRNRGCLLCHVAAEGGPGGAPALAPLPAAATWFLRARFDHRSHRFRTCADCHDMLVKRAPANPALPNVASCRECHQENAAPPACATCHRYHR